MVTPFPPDNSLGIPKHRHEQLGVLVRMFGDPEPLPTSAGADNSSSLLAGVELRTLHVTAGPAFTPTPGMLDDTRTAGRLFWRPHKVPYEQKVGWHRTREGGDPRTICVQITHAKLDGNRHPRTEATCAELREDIAAHGAKLGTYRVTIDQVPGEWTHETIKDLAFLMDALLPGDDRDPKRTHFSVQARGRDAGLTLRQYGNNNYFAAQIHFCGVSPILREWCLAFGWSFSGEPPTTTDHKLAEIDALGQPKAKAVALPPSPAAKYDDDDDLDAIEKAARRRLHGQKNIPNTSRAGTDPAESILDNRRIDARKWLEVTAALQRLSARQIELVGDLIEELARKGSR